MTDSELHKPRPWKDWTPTPEILAEAIDLMKNHPLNLWDKIKDGEKDENALKNIPLEETYAITSQVLYKRFGEVDLAKRICLSLAIRKQARRELGIIDRK